MAIVERAKTALPRWESISRYAWSTSALSISLIAHTVALVILARYLGVEQFGLLSLITTGANLALAGCGLGSGEVLRRLVARDPANYPAALGHALTLIVTTGLVLTICSSLLIAAMVKISPDFATNFKLIAMVVFSNVVLFTWIGLVEQILLAHDQVKEANVVNLSSGAGRIIAVGVACLGFGVDNLQTYIYWHIGFYFVVAVFCGASIVRFGAPRGYLLPDELVRGGTISLASLMILFRKNLDVLVVGAVASPATVGVYAVATRVVATASVVTASLDRLIYSNQARSGQLGVGATLIAARRYAGYAIALCGATIVALYFVAPYVPLVFGAGYRDAAPLVRLLAGTLLLTSLHWLAVDALTAAERHKERLAVEVVTGLASVGILYALGKTYGIEGVILAVYVTGAMAVIGMWGVLYWLAQRSEETSVAVAVN